MNSLTSITDPLVQSAQSLFKIDSAQAATVVAKYGTLITAAEIPALAGNPVAQEAVEDYSAQLKLDLAEMGVDGEAQLEGKIQGFITTSFALLLKVA